MPQSISIKGIAVGVLVLFTSYFASLRLLDEIFALAPLAPLWVSVSIVALWHCVAILLCVPLAAGYVAGRVAGHDHELNGTLTGLSISLYLIVLFIVVGNYHLFDLNFVLTLFTGPFTGYVGGQLSAGINPLVRRRSAAEAAEIAERRRQEQAQAQAGCKLVMLNDDRTPMLFVVEILKRFFNMEHTAAIATMLHIHDQGRAIAAVFERPEAAQAKLAEITAFIASAGQPLRCVMETSER